VLFHSDSMNIGTIANLKAGGGRAAQTAHLRTDHFMIY